MKTKKINVTVFSVVLFSCMMLLAACQSKLTAELYMESLEHFVEKVEENADSYSAKDWDRKDAEFSKFMDEKFEKVKDQLTPDDKRKIGELTARYTKARLRGVGSTVKGTLEEWMDYVKGFTDELQQSMNVFESFEWE